MMGEKKRRQHNHPVERRTTRTVESQCLNCGKLMDAATGAGHDHKPTEGSIGICISCNHIMAYDADLKLRELNDEEIREIAGHPEILRIMRIKGEADKIWKWRQKLLKTLKSNEYICDVCLGVFEKGWSESDAMAEKNIIFPDAPMDECGLVCETCFKKMNEYFGIKLNQKAPRIDN